MGAGRPWPQECSPVGENATRTTKMWACQGHLESINHHRITPRLGAARRLEEWRRGTAGAVTTSPSRLAPSQLEIAALGPQSDVMDDKGIR